MAAIPGRVRGDVIARASQAQQVLSGLFWAAQLAAHTDSVAASALAGLSSVTTI